MHTSATSVMFIPHNFADRDPSRESVQGVRLQLKGNSSGGFAGFPDFNNDLRSRMNRRAKIETKHQAKYFGATYDKGVKLPLESFEPDLMEYKSSENAVNDLSFNRSAAGAWTKQDA